MEDLVLNVMKDVKHANMKPQTVLNIKMDILSEEENVNLNVNYALEQLKTV